MTLSSPIPQESPATILLLAEKLTETIDLCDQLQSEGYKCHSVVCILDAEREISGQDIDLLVIWGSRCVCDQVAHFRKLTAAYLPIIVLSDTLTDQVLDYYADTEIDAVLINPLNFRLLLIKIRSLLRLRQLYKLENEHRKQLQHYSEMLDLEREVAAKIFNNILKGHLLDTEVIKAVISPMSLFNGDLILAGKTPEDHLHLLLGDFTGHGLAASIAAKPVALIFSGMTQKGFSIADIATEVNVKLYNMLPSNIFLAVTIAALNPEAKTLSLITCGLPEHFLIDHSTKSYKSIRSVNIPLGILPTVELHEQVLNLHGGERLYMLTDGIFEAENREGEPFGAQRILDAVCDASGDGVGLLQARLAEHCGSALQKDDMTFVKLICDIENVPWRQTEAQNIEQLVPALDWKNLWEFEISTLREINPVPLMVNTIMEIQGLEKFRQEVFLIVSELFANALDHGLLGLDSRVKATPDGFMQFYTLKEERLKACRQGKVRFLFLHRRTERGGQLVIKVSDSGAGFNWRHWTQELEHNRSYSGRGVRLVQALCSSLSFLGKGNQVRAVFDWMR